MTFIEIHYCDVCQGNTTHKLDYYINQGKCLACATTYELKLAEHEQEYKKVEGANHVCE